MTFEEYNTALSGIVSNPDAAPGVITSVLDSLKADLTSLDALTAQATKDAQRIRDLQDTNTQLFLRVTGHKAEETKAEEKPKTGEAAIDEFFSNLEKGDNK